MLKVMPFEEALLPLVREFDCAEGGASLPASGFAFRRTPGTALSVT